MYVFLRLKLKIPRQYDRRFKLTDKQREQIRRKYKKQRIKNISQLARDFNVSRRLIGFIVDPESYRRVKEDFKQRCKNGKYYDKEKHARVQKEIMQRKYRLYKSGVLTR